MIDFLQMNIDYELKQYKKLLLNHSKNDKICIRKRKQILSLKSQIAKLRKSVKVIKLKPKLSQESELDLFYNNILKHGGVY